MPGNIRWHLVPSKNSWLARWLKLAAMHGEAARSIVTSMSPWLVDVVMAGVPSRGSSGGGVPTSTATSPLASRHSHPAGAPALGLALGLALGPKAAGVVGSSSSPVRALTAQNT